MLAVTAMVKVAEAKVYDEVGHCDQDTKTQIEICYGTDGKLLNGMAAEGDQSFNSGRKRREIRKQVKKGTYSLGSQTYILSRFRNGRKDGLSREVNEFGYDKTTINYRKGVKDGAYSEFYSEDLKKVEAFYKDGLLHGKAIFYNDRGKKIGVARYKNGVLVAGYCHKEDEPKQYFSHDFIKSQPKNELVSCQ